MSAFPDTQPTTPGTRDGEGAGDHDEPFTFGGQRPSALLPGPFTTLQYARLLVLRGRVRDGLVALDDLSAAPPELSVPSARLQLKAPDLGPPCFSPALGHPTTCRRCQPRIARARVAQRILLEAGLLASS
jgi:hypothetical protein